MSNYISFNELEERVTSKKFDNLTNVTGYDQNSLVNQIILESESFCDGYLGTRYSVPVPASYMIKNVALDIATYYLYLRGAGGDVPSKIDKLYQNARKTLEAISKGLIIPPDTSSLSLSPNDTLGSSFYIDSNDSYFTEDDIDGCF
jgi:phage gp36-like protein